MLIKHELKSNWKMFVIWTFCLGIFDMIMLLVYPSLQETMKDMASNFDKMGALATAFGMDKLNIADTIGFYGTYVGVMLSLCGALFAAMLSCGILSKEEGGHTVEYLFTLPYSRLHIMIHKITSVVILVVAFDIINYLFGLTGLALIDADVSMKFIGIYHMGQMLFHFEIACIGILISACTRKVNLGIGLGVTLILYFMDMMARILEQMKFFRFITPFYYSNAADVLVENKIDPCLLMIGMAVGTLCLIVGSMIYSRRDLSA